MSICLSLPRCRSLFKPSSFVMELEETVANTTNATIQEGKKLEEILAAAGRVRDDSGELSTNGPPSPPQPPQPQQSTILSTLSNVDGVVMVPSTSIGSTPESTAAAADTEADEFASAAFQIYRSGNVPRIFSKGHPLSVSSKNQTIGDDENVAQLPDPIQTTDGFDPSAAAAAFDASAISKNDKELFGRIITIKLCFRPF